MATAHNVIIVTGASGGIGAATARLFAQRGWAVALAARSTEQIEQMADEIMDAGGEALAVTTDVTKHADLTNLVEQTKQPFGKQSRQSHANSMFPAVTVRWAP